MTVQPKRALAFCLAMLAGCVPNNRSQEATNPLPPGKVVQIGADTFRVRVMLPIDVAGSRAQEQASEYCKHKHKIMVIKDGMFDIGYGFRLTFTCGATTQGPSKQ